MDELLDLSKQLVDAEVQMERSELHERLLPATFASILTNEVKERDSLTPPCDEPVDLSLHHRTSEPTLSDLVTGATSPTQRVMSPTDRVTSPQPARITSPMTSAMTDPRLVPLIMAAVAASANSQVPTASNNNNNNNNNGTVSKRYKCENCCASFNNKTTLEAHNKLYCPAARQVASTTATAATQSAINNLQSLYAPAVLLAMKKQFNSLASPPQPISVKNESSSTPVATNLKKHLCDDCGARFMHLATLHSHRESYCPGKQSSDGTSPSELLTNVKREPSTSLKENKLQSSSTSPSSPSDSPQLSNNEFTTSNIDTAAFLGNLAIPGTVSFPVNITRKRRSPSIDPATIEKPYAKFQCKSCGVKYNDENTLKIHEAHYCLQKSLKQQDTKSFVVTKRENEPANKRTMLRDSPLGSIPETPSETEIVICKLCDGPVESRFVRHHLDRFHRVVGEVARELIDRYCTQPYSSTNTCRTTLVSLQSSSSESSRTPDSESSRIFAPVECEFQPLNERSDERTGIYSPRDSPVNGTSSPCSQTEINVDS